MVNKNSNFLITWVSVNRENKHALADDLVFNYSPQKRLSIEEQPFSSEISVPLNYLESVTRGLTKSTFIVHLAFLISVPTNGANFVTRRQRTLIA